MRTGLDFVMLPALDRSISIYFHKFKNIISKLNLDAEIYLFGSVAKGQYNKNSDLDLLVLLDVPSIEKLTRIEILEVFDLAYLDYKLMDVDVKIYSRDKFFNSNNYFEKSIVSDLVPLKNLVRRCKFNYEENNVGL